MPNLHLDDPVETGVTSTSDESQTGEHGALDLVNFWFDPAIGRFVTRPPFATVSIASAPAWSADALSGTPNCQAVGFTATLPYGANNPTGGLWVSDIGAGAKANSQSAPWVSGAAALTSVGAAASWGPTLSTYNMGWTRTVGVGGKLYAVVRSGMGLLELTTQTFFNLYNNPGGALAVTALSIKDAVWAFGRLWVIGSAAGGQGVMLWSNAGGSSFATASSGGGMTFGTGTSSGASADQLDTPRAIIRIGNQLCVVWSTCVQYWGAGDGNTTPVNPSGANGLVLIKQVNGIGCDVTGFVQNVGESGLMLTSAGLVSLDANQLTNQFVANVIAEHSQDAASRFYYQVVKLCQTVGNGVFPGYGAHMLWDYTTRTAYFWAPPLGQAMVVSLAKPSQGPKVSFWQGTFPYFTAVVDLQGPSGGVGTYYGPSKKVVGWSPGAALLYVLDFDPATTADPTYYPTYTWGVAYPAQAAPTLRRAGKAGFMKAPKRAVMSVRYALRNRVPGAGTAIGSYYMHGPSQTINSNVMTAVRAQNPVVPGNSTGLESYTGTRVSVPLAGSSEEFTVGVYIQDARDIQLTFDALDVQFNQLGRATGMPR